MLISALYKFYYYYYYYYYYYDFHSLQTQAGCSAWFTVLGSGLQQVATAPRSLFSFFLQGQYIPQYLCCPQQCCFLDNFQHHVHADSLHVLLKVEANRRKRYPASSIVGDSKDTKRSTGPIIIIYYLFFLITYFIDNILTIKIVFTINSL